MRKKDSWNTPVYNIECANAFRCSGQRYFKMLYILLYSFSWVIVYSAAHPLTLNIFCWICRVYYFIVEWYIMLHLTYYTTVVLIHHHKL